MKNSQKLLTEIIIVAVFTALCFTMTFVQVKMPTGDMVHLGNFVMILAALLLGGLVGGLVGSLGMGLYDLIFYTQKPSTIIRTFILKFIVGFLVGYLFRLVLKRKLKTKTLLTISGIFFFSLAVISLILFFVGDRSNLSFKTGLVSDLTQVFHLSKKIKVSLYIPIFSFVFSIVFLVSFILDKNLSERSKAALFAMTVAVIVNILGEFILRWLLEGIFNVFVSDIKNGFSVSLVTATSKIPGSLITAFLSVVLAVLIYEPVYLGVKNLSFFKEHVENDTEDITEEVEENKELEEIIEN